MGTHPWLRAPTAEALSDRDAYASFVMATIIPISTNTTIAICIQIQVGDIAIGSVLLR